MRHLPPEIAWKPLISLWLLLTICAVFTAGRQAPRAAGQSIPGNGTLPPAVRINEFMADNETTLQDEDGDYPDWIELFNAGDTAVDLAGWALTDKPNALDRWTLPDVTIPPRGYLLILASDKDRRTPGEPLHANFRLKAAGEFLALVDPDGSIASAYSPAFPLQYPDVSYGSDAAGNMRYFRAPTPGSDNDVAENLGPIVDAVVHTPATLDAGQALEVAAHIRPAQHAVTDVTLTYRINFGPEREIAMSAGPTQADGSRRYTAAIPADVHEPGDLVRYAVYATDAGNHSARWPLFVAPSHSPQYEGTMTTDPNAISGLPVFYWFMQDVEAAGTREGSRAAVFYDNILYDNVRVRLRGETTVVHPKQSFKFHFNDAYHLRLTGDGPPVDEINVNSNVQDYSHLRQTLAWETFRDAGVPYSRAFPVRVQRNGAFYGLFTLVEQPEEPYFERQGLDWNGALYKVNFNDLGSHMRNIEKKTREEEDLGDLAALIAGIHQTGNARTAYLFDNIDLPGVINYLAVSRLIHHWDMVIKNHYLYRDTEGTGEWTFLPWDMDLTFGAPSSDGVNSHPLHGTAAYPVVYVQSETQYWNRLIDAVMTTPALRAMYLRRLRSVMDQFLQEPETPYLDRHYEMRIEELGGQIYPEVQLDAARWGVPESYSTALNRLRTRGIAAQREHLYETHGPGTPAGIIPPAQSTRPSILFGEVGRISSGVDFGAEYFVLTNPNPVAVDISDWRIEGNVVYRFRPGVVIPADGALYVAKAVSAFRNRTHGPQGGMGLFVQGGYEGAVSGQLGELRLLDKSDRIVDRIAIGVETPTRVFLPVVQR